jgi:hypothetical protein
MACTRPKKAANKIIYLTERPVAAPFGAAENWRYTQHIKDAMDLTFEVYHALCSMQKFKINGISADKDDFGENHDHNPEDAEPYGCGNMQFTAKSAEERILKKYKISPAEYKEICDKLEASLSFGTCGWCA